jgi:hypothetical protein
MVFNVICSSVKYDFSLNPNTNPEKDINTQLSNLEGIKSVSRPSLVDTHSMSDPVKVCVTVEFHKAVENISKKMNF